MHRSCTVSSINSRIRVHPPESCVIKSNFNFNTVAGLLTAFVILFCPSQIIFAQQDEPMELSVVAVNPSDTKTQTVPIKMYLPKEVTPDAVLDTAGLDIEFDSEKSMYYLYKEEVKLKPSETKVFNVEIKDVWIIPQGRLDSLSDQARSIISRLEGSEFHDSAKLLGEAIDKALQAIVVTQSDQAVSRRTHIGIFRSNTIIHKQVKEDVDQLEKQLEIVMSLPKLEVLENIDIKTKSPTESASWMIIFIIMIFIAMLAGVFFFTWQTQAHSTKELISEAREDSFPEREASED